jgi:hypothetical protein
MLKQVIEIFELLDSARVNGQEVADFLKQKGLKTIEVEKIDRETSATDIVKARVPGTAGRASGGSASTLGIIGRLGGIGARPERIGLVSDADGAAVALSCTLKLAEMCQKGDHLKGDVVLATHICPNAPTKPHYPVPFMPKIPAKL